MIDRRNLRELEGGAPIRSGTWLLDKRWSPAHEAVCGSVGPGSHL